MSHGLFLQTQTNALVNMEINQYKDNMIEMLEVGSCRVRNPRRVAISISKAVRSVDSRY